MNFVRQTACSLHHVACQIRAFVVDILPCALFQRRCTCRIDIPRERRFRERINRTDDIGHTACLGRIELIPSVADTRCAGRMGRTGENRHTACCSRVGLVSAVAGAGGRASGVGRTNSLCTKPPESLRISCIARIECSVRPTSLSYRFSSRVIVNESVVIIRSVTNLCHTGCFLCRINTCR